MNILIVGVGGQGTLLSSRVLGKYASLTGKECKLSEVHGMAQRGGSVVTHVRMADKVYAPIITMGEVDVLIAFEELEALRWKHYLKEDGHLVVNSQKIFPMPVIMGLEKYPEDVEEQCKSVKNCHFVNAVKLAEEVGSAKATNIVMLGAVCALCNMDKEIFAQSVTACVPAKFLELNQKAFSAGYDSVK
ncbi:MAG: indolepyruvate oxidoreductase subunit beta [Clostridia bacterium]|nr:indolepyruvate oxidoreductase subunit beta [Clostridia bacterium]